MQNKLKIGNTYISNCLFGGIKGVANLPVKNINLNGVYFLSKEKKLAYFDNYSWHYILPQDGLILWSEEEKKIFIFHNGNWNPI